MYMRVHAYAIFVAFTLISASAIAAPLDATWERERWAGGEWASDDARFEPDAEGVVTFLRGAPHRARLTTTIEADLAETPWLEILAHGSTAAWRLTASFNGGPVILVADQQTTGTCRRDLADRLGADGPGELTLHMLIWGWGSGADHYVRFTPSLLAAAEHGDARDLLGEMAVTHARMARTAEDIRLRAQGYPRLRFNDGNRDRWRALAEEHPQYAQPFVGILADLEARKAEEPYVYDAETARTRRPAFGANLLSVRPPEAPELAPHGGANPFGELSTEGSWRQLYWHNFSHWLIGDALSDDPAFREQARRWAVTLCEWRFHRDPDYIYFDFGTSYPLQSLSSAYDIAHGIMSEDERTLVRDTIATLAHGLYLNSISGHGSIYNDLRGNHTSVTFAGLNMAGCLLLGEDERAPLWIALAERFMLDSFAEHTSGAWVESPSYGV